MILREDFRTGTLSADLSNVATTAASAAFANLPVVAAPDFLKVVIDPLGEAGNPEIVYVTAHTAASTTVTVSRGQEGSIARSHAAPTTWRHGPTADDFVYIGTGTLAQRPAAGTVGRIYTATWAGTLIVRRYHDNGDRWISLDTPFGKFNPLDYGADPTGAADSRTAIVACLTAASTALDTGLPYGTGVVYGEIEWTCGQYVSASSITLPVNIPLRMTGVGGSIGDYQWAQRVVVKFTTGGFVLSDAQSNALEWDGLIVEGAPALFVDRGSGPGQLRNCELRSVTAGTSPLQIRNSFWGDFDHVTLRAPNTSTPCCLIESDDALGGGFEGWLYRFRNCRSESGSDFIRWDIAGAHGTVVGQGIVLDSCDTENIGANAAWLHIRNTHATESTTFHDVSIRNCSHQDNAGDADVLKLTTLGSGSLVANSVNIEHSDYGSSGYHVRHVETGGGAAHADKLVIHSQGNPRVLFGASPGGYGAMVLASGSAWDYRGDRTTAVGLRARVDGDTHDRLTVRADGFITWGPGTGAGDVNLYRNDPDELKTDEKFLAALGIGVGNSAAATVLGSVTRKMQVFDASGNSLGYVPIYDAIT